MMKGKFKFIDVVIGLLTIIAILLVVGIKTAPNKSLENSATSNENNTVSSNKNFAARNYNYFTVDFDSNGGRTIESQYVEYGDTATKPTDPVKYCYDFNGWYLDGERYYFSSPVMEDIVLEAKWTYNSDCHTAETYTVTFNSNGGSYVSSQRVLDGDNAYEPEEPYRSGYTFEGWYLNSTKYNFNKDVTKDITLTAKWTQNKTTTYKVSFNSNGGTSVSSQTVEKGGYAYEPANPTKYGYIFEGWYLNNNRYYFDEEVTKNITLIARWIDEDEYYDNNYSDNYYDDYYDSIYGDSYYDDYYDNYYDNIYNDSYYEDNYNDNYYNRYETYTVTFNSNGGSSVSRQTVYYGEEAEVPNEPTRRGYTFEGWYLNGEVYDFNEPVTRDITLRAHWSEEEDQYAEYCRRVTRTYYSTSYVRKDSGVSYYDWTIKFDNINAKTLQISNVNYITSNSDYESVYRDFYDKQISMVNSTSSSILIPSSSALKTHSLKSGNFYKTLGTPYYENGSWYVKASVSIVNYIGATPYYADSINSYIYTVPFSFKATYVDLDDCITDLLSNRNSYSNYSIVDTFYQ